MPDHPWLGLWPGKQLEIRQEIHTIAERIGYALVYRREEGGQGPPETTDTPFAPGWVDLRLKGPQGQAWLTVRYDQRLQLALTRLASEWPFEEVPDDLRGVMAGHRTAWHHRGERFSLEEEGTLQDSGGTRVKFWHFRAPSSERLHLERWGEREILSLYVGERLRLDQIKVVSGDP